MPDKLNPDKLTPNKLTHFDETGRPHMVDIGAKADTKRIAIAAGFVRMSLQTMAAISDHNIAKGDVIAIAELAGIMGAKQTANLIPLCHPLGLDHVALRLSLDDDGITIEAECHITGKTGVEMEALTAVSVAALTIYDMCKAIDKAMVIENVRLIHKSGGKSGVYNADGGS